MSRPIVKNVIDGASSGKLPNVTTVVNTVMKDVTPRVQELVKVALTGGDVNVSAALPIGQTGTAGFSASSAVSYADEKDFTVEIIKESDSVRITRYNGKNTELNIPPRIGDRPVTEIGERVFMKKGLVSVVIPDSVVFIGSMAFADNQILSVSIGSNVYITNNAFENSGYNSLFVGFYNGQGRKGGTYNNSWNFVAGAPVRSASSGTAPASTTGAAVPVSAASANPALNDVEIISPTSGWVVNKDKMSSSDITLDKEQIDGQERYVLTIDVNAATNGWAGAYTDNLNIIQNLRGANGVRFKALGDGKKWKVQFDTSDVKDNCFHGTIITTQKGKVTSHDISFSRLKQSDWGKQTKFNKDNIIGMKFERNGDTGTGKAIVKIFDFEIY